MIARLLLTALLAAPAIAQDTPPREPREDFWAEVAEALEETRQAGVDDYDDAGAFLLALTYELEDWLVEEPDRFSYNDLSFERAQLLQMLRALLSTPEGFWSENLEEGDLEHRLRRAARRAREYERIEVELFLARRAAQRGELGLAEQVLRAALKNQEFIRVHSPFLALIADLQRLQSDWTGAFATIEEARTKLKPLSDKRDGEALFFVGPVECTVFGVEAQTCLEYGLADEARSALRAEEAVALELVKENISGAGLLLTQSRIRWLEYYLLRGQYGQVVRDASRALTNAALDPDHRAILLTQKGVAQARVSTPGSEASRRARRDLGEALESTRLVRPQRVLLRLELAGLDLKEGLTEQARQHLAALSADLREDAVRSSRFADWRARASALALALDLRESAPKEQCERSLATLRDDFRVLREEWRRSRIRPGGIHFLGWPARREVFGMLVEGCFEVLEDGGATAIAELLETQAQGSLARQEGLLAGSLEGLRAALLRSPDERRGVIVFLPALERTRIVAVGGDRCQWWPAPGERELRPFLDDWQEALLTALQQRSGEVPRRLTAACRRLADLLLPEEVQRELESWDRVWIGGSHLLSDLCFEMLPLDGGELLGLKMPVASLPSGPVVQWLEQRRRAAPPSPADPELFLLADPEQSEEATRSFGAPLDLGESDLNALTEPFRSTRVLTGPDATLDSLRSPEVARAGMLALFSHGTYDGDLPIISGFVVCPPGAGQSSDPPSGIVRVPDVLKLSAPALVSLSVCGAARSRERYGEDGLSHLAGAWLASGADTVISTAYDVRLNPVLTLSALFHEHLAKGLDPTRALQQARRGLARESGDLALVHGCLMQVVGLGCHAPFPTP